MAQIHPFPARPQLTWQPTGEVMHRRVLERTGSRSIAYAVEARCHQIFDAAVPVLLAPDVLTHEELNKHLVEYIHTITGKLLAECERVVEENELLKRAT